jgi:hypothetical protein
MPLRAVTGLCTDAGRDAIWEYSFGPKFDQIAIDFALEAKCKQLGSGVGVKEISRLISAYGIVNLGFLLRRHLWRSKLIRKCGTTGIR